MSKFNHYAVKADKIAREALTKLIEAENSLRKAETTRNRYPKHKITDARYAADSARAEADYLDAKENLFSVQRSMDTYRREIKAVRDELAAALTDEFSVDPKAIDGNVMELLKSGVMRPAEYVKLLNQAQDAGNHTMARIISRYADSAARELEKKYPPTHPNHRQVQELRAAAIQGTTDPTGDKLAAFDVIVEAFSRSTMNTGMVNSWDLMTAPVIEAF